MDAIPHRKQLVARLRAYPDDHALFLELTREEYYLQLITLPHDTVKSPAMDGMPHGTEVSAPTLSMVCQRETIVERITAQRGKLNAELIQVADRLNQFWDWWVTQNATVHKFVELRYWNRASYQDIERFFRAESDRYYGDVPDEEDKVYRFERTLLKKLDHLWYYGPAD